MEGRRAARASGDYYALKVVRPTGMTITADDALQECMGGNGVVAVLLRNSATHVVVDCIVETATVQMTLPITALEACCRRR